MRSGSKRPGLHAFKSQILRPRVTLLALLVVVCAFEVLPSVPGPRQAESPGPFVVYFDDGPLPLASINRNDTIYVPLTPLVRRMSLPYTDATALGTFTVRGPLGTLTVTDQTAEITVGDATVNLEAAPFREDGEWFVPTAFLMIGLERISGVDFRYQPGAPRILAGVENSARLGISASENGGETRLTIRSEVSVNVRVQQIRDENRVLLQIERAPMRPVPETLDYRDALIRSVRFDDSDGRSTVVVETTPQVASVRLTPSDENRTFFIDFVPERAAPTEAAAAPFPVPDPDPRASAGTVRVVVIDPGHGGLDAGTRGEGTAEKDLTLALARNVRARLQNQLDTTVILTRDSDLALTSENRSAIANNSRANLLISLHVGFSYDPTESGASIFIMKDMDGASGPPDGLFRRWYRAYRPHLDTSRQFGSILRQNLMRTIPGWTFPIREAPGGLLASANMPAVLLELGNARNPANIMALNDAGFQARIVEAIVGAVTEFGTAPAGE